jgi:very-short-patch-repair endonuclease
MIEEILMEYSIKYAVEVPISGEQDKRNELHLDFVLPLLRIALEYDGDYWHDQKQNKEAENRKASLVKEMGLYLVRIRQQDIKTDPEKSLLKIILHAAQNS